MEELKVSKDRVIEVAKTCPDVDRVMRRLFPEAFENKWIDVSEKLARAKLGDVTPFLEDVENDCKEKLS